jgi:hypothetical protein
MFMNSNLKMAKQTVEHDQQSLHRKLARPFDSLGFAKRLQAGGVFTREQAEVLAEEQAAADDRLATKDDIEALRRATQKDIEGIHKDIEALRLETKAEIEKSKAEILKWMFGQTVFLLTSLAGIVALLIHVNKP